MSAEDHLSLSTSQALPENFDAVPLKDNLVIEWVDGDEETDEAADVFSVKSTPTHGRSFQTAKKWLGSFLVAVSLYHCAITHAALSRARTIEIAHILLPQCSPPELVCRHQSSEVSTIETFIADYSDWSHPWAPG